MHTPLDRRSSAIIFRRWVTFSLFVLSFSLFDCNACTAHRARQCTGALALPAARIPFTSFAPTPNLWRWPRLYERRFMRSNLPARCSISHHWVDGSTTPSRKIVFALFYWPSLLLPLCLWLASAFTERSATP